MKPSLPRTTSVRATPLTLPSLSRMDIEWPRFAAKPSRSQSSGHSAGGCGRLHDTQPFHPAQRQLRRGCSICVRPPQPELGPTATDHADSIPLLSFAFRLLLLSSPLRCLSSPPRARMRRRLRSSRVSAATAEQMSSTAATEEGTTGRAGSCVVVCIGLQSPSAWEPPSRLDSWDGLRQSTRKAN